MTPPLEADASHPVEWPSRGRAVWMMVVFFLAAVLSYTDRLIFGLLVDPLKADLRISDTQVSLLQGIAFALVYSFAGLPLGRMADTRSRRLVILFGVVLWSLATFLCSLSHSFTELFVARIFVGVGEAALAPAAVSMITDSFPPGQRGTAIGVFLTGMAIGGGAAIAIGGGLLQIAHAGWLSEISLLAPVSPWRSVLALLGVGGFAIALLLLTVREPLRHDRLNAVKGVGSDKVIGIFAKLAPVLVPLYLAVAFVTAGDFALQNWVPTLLSRRFGFSPGEIGASLGTIAMAAGIAGSLFGGLVSDGVARRHGDRGRLRVALWVSLFALIGGSVAFTASPDVVLGMSGWWLLLSAIAETVGVTAIQDIVPNDARGVGVALVSFCNMLFGLGLGTTLTALCTDYVYHDPMAVGLSITTVALPAGIVAALLFRRAMARLSARPLKA